MIRILPETVVRITTVFKTNYWTVLPYKYSNIAFCMLNTNKIILWTHITSLCYAKHIIMQQVELLSKYTGIS